MGRRASHSVAVVLLVMTMTVGTSHCMMSNKNNGAGSTITVTTTTAGNSSSSSIGAALEWCEGYITNAQCDLIIPEAYGGDGERLEYLNQMDMMLQVEYAYGSGESSRRVLATKSFSFKTDATKNPGSQACTNSPKNQAYQQACHGKPGKGPKPGCPKNAPAARKGCYHS